MLILENFKMFEDSNSFSIYIEQTARERKCSHVDAILQYCKENFIDPEDIKSLINKSLKEKMKMDFQETGYLPKTAQLDV
jgi:cell division ATPase FtsA